MNPELMFQCVSWCLGAFETVSFLHKTQSKMCRTGTINAKVHARKSRRYFSLRTHLIHTISPQTNILVCFVMFGCIWYCFITHWTRYKTCRTGAINAKVHATIWSWNFSLRSHPIHTNGPWSHVLVRFIMFGCIWDRFIIAWKSVQNGPKWYN